MGLFSLIDNLITFEIAILLLFQLKRKSTFSIFPPKKFYNINDFWKFLAKKLPYTNCPKVLRMFGLLSNSLWLLLIPTSGHSELDTSAHCKPKLKLERWTTLFRENSLNYFIFQLTRFLESLPRGCLKNSTLATYCLFDWKSKDH